MKKDRRNLVAFILALVMIFSLAACGQSSNSVDKPMGSPATPDDTTTTEPDGDDTPMIPEELPNGDKVVLFNMNARAAYALKSDGTMWGWGNNATGQLGNGHEGNATYNNYTIQTTPIQIIKDVKTFALGPGYVLALKNDNSLWAWGQNECGQVGNGAVGNITVDGYVCQSVPVKILEDVESIYTSDFNFSAAIKTDGSLWMWGNNRAGQCGVGEAGNGSYTSADNIYSMQSVPAKVLDNVTFVTLNGENAAAITSNGKLWVWGDNKFAQTGNNTTTIVDGTTVYVNSYTPQNVLDDVKYVAISYTAAAIQTDGTLFMWGDNSSGQVGNGQSSAPVERPVRVMTGVKHVEVARNYNGPITAAITDADELYTWGENVYYALGIGEIAAYTPQYVMSDVKELHLGDSCAFALTKDGKLWTWGYDYGSRIGIEGPVVVGVGDDTACARPVEITLTKSIETLYSNSLWTGLIETYALRQDSVLLVWGSPLNGLRKFPKNGFIAQVLTDVESFAYLDEFFDNAAAIKKDGSLWIWGINDRGQIGNGTTEDTEEPVQVILK